MKTAIIYSPKLKYDSKMQKMLNDSSVSVIVANFDGVDWHKQLEGYPSFVVYRYPRDFKDKYVVRLFNSGKPTRLITLSDSLDDARKTIPLNYIKFERSRTDDKVIVETWL